MIRCAVVIAACVACFIGKAKGGEDAFVVIQNGPVSVSILTDVGGRVVSLRYGDSANLLLSNEALWFEPEDARPELDGDPLWKEYGGHIVWLAPQSAWWKRQDVRPEMQGRLWPPDPYLIYGPYAVVERTEVSLRLQGPGSPYTGVALTKEISIDAEGRIHLTVTAVNISDQAISWALWTNTRFPGDTRSFFPVAGEDMLSFQHKGSNPGVWEPLPHVVIDGLFTFLIEEAVPDGVTGWRNNVLAHPSSGWVAAFPDGFLFIKRAEMPKSSAIHPEHAFLEIYNLVPEDLSQRNILELEFVGPYLRLEPGESMAFSEVWEVVPYGGEQELDAQLAFLKTWLEEN